ncbi:hypothetical protein [Saccharicrinis sp. 156]|uniref:hypothetical protein n=1 Tax=Saccharicrinis sp. 156 TaxID=3417574 RepID=UPI003D32CEF8
MIKRDWWKNCDIGQKSDSEIVNIDRLEDQIAPLAENVLKTRELISCLEMCHHKAERWVHNILEAIGTEQANKGLGTRTPGQIHPKETLSKRVSGALSVWGAGCPISSIDWPIDSIQASVIHTCLEKRTPLKEWQVQRVIEKIRSWTGWPGSEQDPSTQYAWLVVGQNNCPEYYREHEDFWRHTIETMPFDDLKGLDGGSFSLGLAIYLLWTCHWKFVENLQIILEVIGGNLKPQRPFAACAWNISLSPLRPRMEVVCNSLKIFCGEQGSDKKNRHRCVVNTG